jgi:isoamyl acetate esterase
MSASSTVTRANHNPPNERRRVVLVGDSITQQSFSIAHGGWGAGLADWYQRTADVSNRGFSGYNSRWVKQSFEILFPSSAAFNSDVILVTLLLGANDAAFPSPQHISLEEYRSNISYIITHLQSVFPLAKCILITPPQVNNELWPDRSIPKVSEYAEVIRQLSSSLKVPMLDLWKDDEFRVEIADLRDGLHLGLEGNRKVCEGLQDLVRTHYPHIVPEETSSGQPNLSYQLPQHRELGDLCCEADSEKVLKNWSW